MVIALPVAQVESALALLNANGENAWHIGEIAALDDATEQVEII